MKSVEIYSSVDVSFNHNLHLGELQLRIEKIYLVTNRGTLSFSPFMPKTKSKWKTVFLIGVSLRLMYIIPGYS